MCVIDDSNDLSTLNAISLAHSNLNNRPRYLARQQTGLRGLYRSHRLQKIRESGYLRRNDGKLPNVFRRAGAYPLIALATAHEPNRGEQEHEHNGLLSTCDVTPR